MQTPDVTENRQASTASAPTGLLGGLRDRLLKRAVLCSTYRQEAITKGWWHEAHEAEVRRGVWLAAAEMVLQEESTPNGAHERTAGVMPPAKADGQA